MTEDEAQDWVATRWGAAAVDGLKAIATLVVDEADRQNLVAKSTIGEIWSRHLTDSAQLVALAGTRDGRWLDIGTGGGFPGLVVAALRSHAITFVEPRRRRADFLLRVVEHLGLQQVSVVVAKAESIASTNAAIVSARAVAPLGRLLAMQLYHGSPDTLGLFPRGHSGQSELGPVQDHWNGVFHVKQSVTQPGSVIIMASALELRR